MRKTILAGLVALASALLVAPASATVALQVEAGATTKTITDCSGVPGTCPTVIGGDTIDAADVISWSGSIGTWLINVTTGFGDSAWAGLGILDLGSQNTGANPGDALTLRFSETGFDAGSVASMLYFFGSMGATNLVNTSVSWSLLVDDNNSLFGGSSVLSGTGTGFNTGSTSVTGLYSMTLVAVLTPTGTGTTGPRASSASIDYQAGRLPEPGTLALLGLGMAGLALVSRRKRQ